MYKINFLLDLESRLKVLNKVERDDIVNEYSDVIDQKVKTGKTELEAVHDFGNIDELVSEIYEAYHLNPKYVEEEEEIKEVLVLEGLSPINKFLKIIAFNFRKYLKIIGNYIKKGYVGFIIAVTYIIRKSTSGFRFMINGLNNYLDRKKELKQVELENIRSEIQLLAKKDVSTANYKMLNSDKIIFKAKDLSTLKRRIKLEKNILKQHQLYHHIESTATNEIHDEIYKKHTKIESKNTKNWVKVSLLMFIRLVILITFYLYYMDGNVQFLPTLIIISAFILTFGIQVFKKSLVVVLYVFTYIANIFFRILMFTYITVSFILSFFINTMLLAITILFFMFIYTYDFIYVYPMIMCAGLFLMSLSSSSLIYAIHKGIKKRFRFIINKLYSQYKLLFFKTKTKGVITHEIQN